MKVSLIYLAAGNSHRFGSNKLLYDLDGKPLYRHLLDRLENICIRHPDWEVVVVTQYRQVYDEAGRKSVRVVWSPASHKGASYSVRAGLKAAKAAEACAFFVADQPCLTEENAEAFLEAMERKRAGLGCVVCGGRRGNPTWFSRKYFQELSELKEDQGGRKVLGAHLEEAVYWPISQEWELWDMDTVSDMVVCRNGCLPAYGTEKQKGTGDNE